MRFLRENWIWIAIPFALAAILVTFLLVVGSGSDSPFVYNIF